MTPGSAECTHVHSSSMIWACNVRGVGVGWNFWFLKIMVLNVVNWKYGYNLLIFPSLNCFDTYIGTDSRVSSNGYPLCTYLPPSIYGVPFTGLHIHPLTLYKISP